ncbi:hypothetical protein BDFB_010748 [Asbolus verrucosus]|uniref:Uncharacterized protein n=1 Tax=Asbolus verrucosus TaxID=1661398 RepID=A0A482VMM6_ASBVE|nr:hypothetical protein BDFB_010748 [Asbolus verrucosus]
MVLQVLDLVNPTSEPFYGDCPAQTYTDLDVNTTGHTTCTVIPSAVLSRVEVLSSETWRDATQQQEVDM